MLGLCSCSSPGVHAGNQGWHFAHQTLRAAVRRMLGQLQRMHGWLDALLLAALEGPRHDEQRGLPVHRHLLNLLAQLLAMHLSRR